MCQSLHVAINKYINWCFVHSYLLFYYKDKVFMLVVNYNPSVFHGHEDTKPWIFWGHDFDVISHVTIGLGLGTFLSVVWWPSVYLAPLRRYKASKLHLPMLKAKGSLRMLRVTWLVGRGSKMTTYLEFPWPYCLFTLQLCLRWRLGADFLQERLWPKIFKSVSGPISTLGDTSWVKLFTSNFGSLKGLTLAWSRVVRAVVRENPPGGLTCRSVNKKGI